VTALGIRDTARITGVNRETVVTLALGMPPAGALRTTGMR
jgi:hypothetical protein